MLYTDMVRQKICLYHKLMSSMLKPDQQTTLHSYNTSATDGEGKHLTVVYTYKCKQHLLLNVWQSALLITWWQ